MKTASIVIPTFNRARLVTRAIDSALNQTYPCEVVVCDHGSTDDTPSVMEKYKGRIRYIRREKDQGPIACWRDGIEQSTGEIVNLTYDDDWLETTFMAKTMARLDDDIGFVYTNFSTYYHDKTDTTCGLYHPTGIGYSGDIVRYLIQAPLTISPGCAIFRRRDILKNLLLEIPNAQGKYGKNSGVGEDLLLFLLTSLDYPKYFHIAEPLACFFSHPTSITVGAMLAGERRNIVDSYANAKSYYFSLPGSVKSMGGLQRIFFIINWRYRAGVLLKDIIGLLGRVCIKK